VLRALAPLVAVVAACCHPTAPQREFFEKRPSAANGKALNEVIARLDFPGGEVRDLEQRLRGRLEKPTTYKPSLKPFLAGLKCKPLGCYATLPAASREAVAQIEDFATNPETPLRAWGGWRYLSGLYEERSETGLDRVQTIVLLDEKPYAQKGAAK
jgi:hypothetical protein